ncbi:hypothetical protein [Ferrovibrio sp.]|uniref:hypothetical protein n=1 Tax=Ferrovibrio sp. TaxID=1917215 RepID=UPI003D124397
MLNTQTLFVAVLGVTLINGFVSPIVPLVFLWAPVWMPEFAPQTPIAILYGTSLIVSISTLIVSGVPAALFERFTGRQMTDTLSMLVWLGAAFLLTLPGLI